MSVKAISYAFSRLVTLKADRATYYVSARRTVRVVKVKGRTGRYVVTVGKPNYLERQNIRKWAKEGTPLESIQIVVYFRGKKRPNRIVK